MLSGRVHPYRIVREHGLQFPTNGFRRHVGNGELSFIHATQSEGTKPHSPDPVVNEFQADGVLTQGVTDGYALGFPANASVAADEPYLPVGRVV